MLRFSTRSLITTKLIKPKQVSSLLSHTITTRKSMFSLDRSMASQTQSAEPQSVHDFNVKDADGNDVDLGIFKGKVLLIVNVTSQSGLTNSNYTQLTDLYHKYKDQDPMGFDLDSVQEALKKIGKNQGSERKADDSQPRPPTIDSEEDARALGEFVDPQLKDGLKKQSFKQLHRGFTTEIRRASTMEHGMLETYATAEEEIKSLQRSNEDLSKDVKEKGTQIEAKDKEIKDLKEELENAQQLAVNDYKRSKEYKDTMGMYGAKSMITAYKKVKTWLESSYPEVNLAELEDFKYIKDSDDGEDNNDEEEKNFEETKDP